ncbi:MULTISPECIES: cell division protein FtsQ/DivIB [unclassified Coleofasciculus]|uniref:cell division protein FtsQ/DivIB n=1 Tax=unclassified Coleofasciculus TaxID=2692782 RepID=UPI001880EE4F|nr:MULTISPECIES: FtsQ-type POTRA domain-containing protein [unclassified Coleofasciculus]MBE9128848.1 FtsQ-type POTRA domain-containing protein [Coleofasciculus sp. LEGE 07081]MBE9151528.1 FtsQ-type POTRA domain-containing protein [Coleofasciculus sp. LEGE 07092]
MANIASVSQAQLANRRQKLRQARRIKFFQGIWRSLLVSGMAGGLVWAITLPDWVIRQPEQIAIEGNQYLSTPAIRSLLPLSYPQSLLRVEPQSLINSLESQAPIADATITRQLIPPRLIIQVKERQPVAIAVPIASSQAKAVQSTPEVGFLDEQGVWMPQSSYRAMKENVELPTLKVIGSNQHYHSYWSDVYQAVSHSPVKVLEIDWQNPGNLILKTDLGSVHLGPYSSRLAEQLRVLDQMRELPDHIKPGQIAYIDLKNPDLPVIQMTQANETP